MVLLGQYPMYKVLSMGEASAAWGLIYASALSLDHLPALKAQKLDREFQARVLI